MDSELRSTIAEGRPVKVPPLAEAMSMSLNAVYEAVKRNEIKSVRVGRAIRIPAWEAARLLGVDLKAAA